MEQWPRTEPPDPRLNPPTSAAYNIDANPANSGNRTWPQGAPPLRITRPKRNWRVGRAPAAPLAPNEPHAPPSKPRFTFQLLRFIVGIALALLAWGGLGLVLALGMSLGVPVSRAHFLTSLAFTALKAAAALWLALCSLVCVVIGAFCLTLGLTNSDWQ